MVCIDYRMIIYSIEWAIVVLEEKSCVELYSMKFFTIIQVSGLKVENDWKNNYGKTEEDSKYQLFNNCSSFIKWIRRTHEW